VGFRRRRWRDVRPDEDKVRVNRAIRIAEVRVVNEDGQQLGVMATDAARDVAQRLGLDLVEISPTARPPVCKIMDYGRYKYELKKKAATAKKSQHQSQVKEIKLRPRISDHDLEFKLRNARKFLFEGDKVKCTVMFRGRDIVHTQVGRELLERVEEKMSEVSAPESRAQMEGRTLSFTLAPNRAAVDKIKAKEQREQAAAAAAEAAEEGEASEEAEAADDGEASDVAEAAETADAPAPSASAETTEETERA